MSLTLTPTLERPTVTVNGLALRDQRLRECRDEVDHLIRMAGERMDLAMRTGNSVTERRAWNLSERADRMDCTLGLLEEAPDSFWMVYGHHDPYSLLGLPASAIEEFTCAEWSAGTSEEDVTREVMA